MNRCTRKASSNPWRAALDRLLHARSLSWSGGAVTEAAWEQVRLGEEGLLAAVPDAATLADKLRYLHALSQPVGQVPLPLAEQPWRHRMLHGAIEDAAALSVALGAAQAECRRLRRAWAQAAPERQAASAEPDQVAALREQLAESLAERDAAVTALARQNHAGLLDIVADSNRTARSRPPLFAAGR